MNTLVTNAAPWLCAFLAGLYWLVFVAEEVRRHYKPTGRHWPLLRERKQIVLVKPVKTHFYGVTAALFTFTLVIMDYKPKGGGIGITVTFLIVYLFVALWCGPMLGIVPIYEGTALMAATINIALYLTVHHWGPAWLTIQSITFWIVIATIWLCLLIQLFTRDRQQQS